MPAFCRALFVRDLRLALRRRGEALLPIGFFVVTVALFPLGIGPEPQTLRAIAPGLMWVCALLASMLSVAQLFTADHADGTLDQLIVIVLPLCVPALIFGTGAVAAVEGGQSATAHCSLLGALLIITALTAPLASAAALRLAVE
jgi:heme exporter protein B